MKTNTAKKMLSIFRQLEENAAKEDIPDGKKLRMSNYICCVCLHFAEYHFIFTDT
jgi:hypothetical protein